MAQGLWPSLCPQQPHPAAEWATFCRDAGLPAHNIGTGHSPHWDHWATVSQKYRRSEQRLHWDSMTQCQKTHTGSSRGAALYELQVNPMADEKSLRNMGGMRGRGRKETKAATYFYEMKKIKAKGKTQPLQSEVFCLPLGLNAANARLRWRTMGSPQGHSFSLINLNSSPYRSAHLHFSLLVGF